MPVFVWIMCGGALGSGARYWLNGWISHRWGETFPVGTLVVNVLGCLVIGFFATLTAPEGRYFASATARQFVMTGILGGFTTFSSFSLQTLNLARDGAWWPALANCVLSVVLCLVGAWLGHLGAAALNR
jgi:CrcB protein